MAVVEAETERLNVLRSLRFLYAPKDKTYADITTVAAHLLDAPIAFVSFVESDYQMLSSCVGLDVDRTSREVSFCSHAIAQADVNQPLVIPDATQDPRFARNPLVTGSPFIRLYVGQPLVVAGQPIGSLCVVHTEPRTPTPAQLVALATLARCVSAMIQARRTAEALRASERRNRTILAATSDSIISVDRTGQVASWNEAADRLFGLGRTEVSGRSLARLIAGPTEPNAPHPIEQLLRDSMTGHGGQRAEMTLRRADGRPFTADLTITPSDDADDPVHTVFVRDTTERQDRESHRREAETRDVAIFAMARLAESRDPETGAHLERVQAYCRTLAVQLKHTNTFAGMIDDEFIDLLHSTSPLHDIGKVGIPDHVLLKPGRLTPAEFTIMRTHTTLGADTLEAAVQRFPGAKFLRMARNIAATHHERYDGSGYPKGLAGDDIPLSGRIVALADVYDALTSRRVYKDAFGHEQARAIIVGDSGRHFDPRIVAAFLSVQAAFGAVSQRHSEPAARAA